MVPGDTIKDVRSMAFLTVLMFATCIMGLVAVRLSPRNRPNALLYGAFTALALALVYVVMAGLEPNMDGSWTRFNIFTDPLVQSFPAVLVGFGATLLAVWAVLWGTDRNEKFNLELDRQRRFDDHRQLVQDSREKAVGQLRSDVLFRLDDAEEKREHDMRYLRFMIDPPVRDLQHLSAALRRISARQVPLEIDGHGWLKLPDSLSAKEWLWADELLRDARASWVAAGWQSKQFASRQSGILREALSGCEEMSLIEPFSPLLGLVALGTTDESSWSENLGILLTHNSQAIAARHSRHFRLALGLAQAMADRLARLEELARTRLTPPFSAVAGVSETLVMELIEPSEYLTRLEPFKRLPDAHNEERRLSDQLISARLGSSRVEEFWASYQRPSSHAMPL